MITISDNDIRRPIYQVCLPDIEATQTDVCFVPIADIAGKCPKVALDSCNSLRRVLHFSAAERPVFATGIHETDPDVFLSHLRSVVDFVRDVAEEPLL